MSDLTCHKSECDTQVGLGSVRMCYKCYESMQAEIERLKAENSFNLLALTAAKAFIDSHVADPDITDEMCKKYGEYKDLISQVVIYDQ